MFGLPVPLALPLSTCQCLPPSRCCVKPPVDSPRRAASSPFVAPPALVARWSWRGCATTWATAPSPTSLSASSCGARALTTGEAAAGQGRPAPVMRALAWHRQPVCLGARRSRPCMPSTCWHASPPVPQPPGACRWLCACREHEEMSALMLDHLIDSNHVDMPVRAGQARRAAWLQPVLQHARARAAGSRGKICKRFGQPTAAPSRRPPRLVPTPAPPPPPCCPGV